MTKYIFSFFLLAFSQVSFAQFIALNHLGGPFPWMLGFETTGNDPLFYTIRQDGFIVIVPETDTLPAGTSDEPPIFLDISTKINLEGEQGLLGLAFHPDYENNGYFYVYYNAVDTKKSTLSRFSRDSSEFYQADPNSEQILLTFDQPTIKHNGGCLKFGPDGYLYLSSGDGGELNDPQNNGQKTNTFLGKILRIDVDNGNPYAIPADNPYDQVFGYYPEIWATGLRNPWRFSFDQMTGDLWISDVGQEEWEEVMFQPAGDAGGHNYGWSCREGTIDFNSFGCFNPDSFTNPTYQYAHNDNPDCSGSITGGFVYRGMQNGDLFGKYIYTDFCTGEFTSLKRVGEAVVIESLGTFNAFDYISFSENRYRELFVNSYFSGSIFKIESIDCEPVAHILSPNTTVGCVGDTLILNAYTTGDTSFIFQWQRNGSDIFGAKNQELKISQTGDYQLVVTNLKNGCTATSDVIGMEFLSASPSTIFNEICEGDSLIFNDETLAETGIYEFNLLSQHGCDSVVFLDLNVLPEESEILELDIEANTFYDGILIQNDTTIIQNLTAENGCDSLVTIHFSILTNTIDELKNNSTYSIYPNPVSTSFLIKMTGARSTNFEIKIYNSFGKEMTNDFDFNENKTQFERKNVPAGVYYLVIKNGEVQTNLRFICL